MSQVQSNITKITFPNGRQAPFVETQPDASAKDIITKLGLANPDAIILILGGDDLQDAGLQSRLVQLFSRGVARAVLDNNALIIDGGAESKALTALAQAVVERNSNLPLLGIADDSKVTWPDRTTADGVAGRKMLDSYHTYFVAVQSSSSGGEVAKMCEIAQQLSQGGPILVVLASDSSNVKDEVVRSVRQSWPILVIQGAGGFADQIQQAWQVKQDYLKALSEWKSTSPDPKPTLPFIDDSVLSEVIAEGDLHFFLINDTPENLAQCIDLKLKASNILNQALSQRQVYRDNANRQERIFYGLQNSILALGVLITALAALESVYQQSTLNVPLIQISLGNLLHFIIIFLPIVLALLIAGANRFNPGNKWISMRIASESFKREIFRYRTHTGNYSDKVVISNGTTREATLAKMLEITTRQWVEGNMDYALFPFMAVPSGNKQRNTGSTIEQPKQARTVANVSLYLSPNGYLLERVADQLQFYTKRSKGLAQRLAILQWIILGLGGLATLLAVFQVALLITVTTALATALASYLEYQQVANTLKQYNHAVLNLTNIQNWWVALGDAQTDPTNIDKLVDYVESTLQSEQAGWVQQMQAALTELRAQQEKRDSSASRSTDGSQQVQVKADGAQNGTANTTSLPNLAPTGPLAGDGSTSSDDTTSPAG